jgi:dolichol-phosphate mannosyltransferase/undecaprenyl-phosphate 4-deoxy-4-formamido-L-arabinose transferase
MEGVSLRTNLKIACSVIIPAFNAEGTIEELLIRVKNALRQKELDFEIVVVDDSSEDHTWDILVRIGKNQDFNLRAFRLLSNVGQHAATVYGIRNSFGTSIVTIDDDLEHNPEDIPQMLAAAREPGVLAIATSAPSGNLVTSTGSKTINYVLRRTFRLPADFGLSTFRAFSREIGLAATSKSKAHPYLTAMLLSVTSRRVNVQVTRNVTHESRYSIVSRFRLALDLLFSYSGFLSVGVMALLGLSALFSLIFSVVLIGRWAAGNEAIQGWTSTLLTIILVGAITQLILILHTLLLFRVYKATFADGPVFVVQTVPSNE